MDVKGLTISHVKSHLQVRNVRQQHGFCWCMVMFHFRCCLLILGFSLYTNQMYRSMRGDLGRQGTNRTLFTAKHMNNDRVLIFVVVPHDDRGSSRVYFCHVSMPCVGNYKPCFVHWMLILVSSLGTYLKLKNTSYELALIHKLGNLKLSCTFISLFFTITV